MLSVIASSASSPREATCTAAPAPEHLAGWPSATCPNFGCKNASADWPMPCQAPTHDGLRFGHGDALPIGGWWPPLCDMSDEAMAERVAFAQARLERLTGDRLLAPATGADPFCSLRGSARVTWSAARAAS